MTIKRPLVMNQPEVGKLIRELRLTLGLTQEQLAVALGVTYSTINRWENGRSKPSPLAMEKIEQMVKEVEQLDNQH
jgi:putative transcriptional regulator